MPVFCKAILKILKKQHLCPFSFFSKPSFEGKVFPQIFSIFYRFTLTPPGTALLIGGNTPNWQRTMSSTFPIWALTSIYSFQNPIFPLKSPLAEDPSLQYITLLSAHLKFSMKRAPTAFLQSLFQTNAFQWQSFFPCCSAIVLILPSFITIILFHIF